MHQHGQVIAGVLKLLDPVKTSGGMTDGHDGRIKLSRGFCLQGQHQGANHRPTQNRQAGVKAGATVVKESKLETNATGESRFRHHLGVTACSKNQQAAHSLQQCR